MPDQEKEAKVRLEVKAEDGTTRDYYITLKLTGYDRTGSKKNRVPAVFPQILLPLSIRLLKKEPVITR